MSNQVIAVGFPTSELDRRAIADEVGRECRIEDIRQAPPDAALVLVRPCSPQALRMLRRSYPSADIVVVDEAAHPENGAVHRALEAGATEYATAADLHELGHRLRSGGRCARARGTGLAGGSDQPSTEVA